MGVNLRIVSIATIYIETILFCQALGGWPAIEWILRNSLHYYDDKCTSLGLEVPCDVQDKAYVRLYSLTYSALKIIVNADPAFRPFRRIPHFAECGIQNSCQFRYAEFKNSLEYR